MKLKPSTAAWLTPAAAFFLSAGLWVLALVLFGFYPFGKYTILITDMGQQYVEFHAALYDMVHSGASLLYTWNTGMGMSFVGIFAYYLASPFTLLLLLFPRAAISEALLLIISLKIACSGLTFSLFLRRGVRINGTINVMFSAAYALSGYAAVFFFNIMWLDAVILLPVVILALLKLIHTQKIAPLAIVLTVLFLINFYTAYMVGFFSFLLLLTLLWLRSRSRWENLHVFAQFLRAALLAACFAAFLLVPAYFSLKECQSMGNNNPVFIGLNTDPLTLFGKFTWGAYDSVTDSGSANLYCSLLALLLIPVWLLNTKISRREKKAGLFLMIFLLISMLFCPLDVLWHACETPVWFPCRYSFTLIFMILTCTARSLSLPEGISPRRILTGLLYAMILIVACNIPEWINPEDYHTMTGNLIVTIVALAVYTLLLLIFTHHKKAMFRRAALWMMILCVSVELTGNAFTVFTKLNNELHFDTQENFSDYMSREENLTATLNAYTDNQGDKFSPTNFYRVENFSARNPNDGLMGGYPSVSHYSSFSQRGTFSFLKNCGMVCTSGNKIFRYTKSASALDAILGIRYLYSPEENRSGYVSTQKQTDGLTLYQNQYALPLAFFADQKIQQMPSSGKNPFSLLNTFFSSLDGQLCSYYTSLSVSSACDGGKLEESNGLTTVSTDSSAILRFMIQNPKYQDVLLYFNNNLPENTPVFVNDSLINPTGERLVHGVIDLGKQPAGTIDVYFTATNKTCFNGLKAAAFDEEAFQKLTDSLRQTAAQNLTVTTAGSEPLVTGKITAPRDGTLFTSIPTDEGWTAVLDGKAVETKSTGGAFLTVPISKGEHTFSLQFEPCGLIKGEIVTGATVVFCLGWFLFQRIQKHRKSRKSS